MTFEIYLQFCGLLYVFFFFKQKTAYELRISDWSSDVCSSDLQDRTGAEGEGAAFRQRFASHGNRGPQNCAHDRPHAEASQQQAEDGRSAVERIDRKSVV